MKHEIKKITRKAAVRRMNQLIKEGKDLFIFNDLGIMTEQFKTPVCPKELKEHLKWSLEETEEGWLLVTDLKLNTLIAFGEWETRYSVENVKVGGKVVSMDCAYVKCGSYIIVTERKTFAAVHYEDSHWAELLPLVKEEALVKLAEKVLAACD